MALNAIDGMLAREFGQKSRLGAYLNELSDVLSDSFLYWPFALVYPASATWIGGIIVLSVVSEMAGVLGLVGAVAAIFAVFATRKVACAPSRRS